MVWTKQQFEREVCRQLIELESIRKRVANKDVLERIDRLEESHLCLLRRLGECFQSASRASATCHPLSRQVKARRKEESSPIPVASRAGSGGANKPLKGLEKRSKCSATLSREGSLRGESILVASDADQLTPSKDTQMTALKETPMDLGPALSETETKNQLPTFGQKCGTCGKILLSSILAGDEVVLRKTTWHHKECVGVTCTFRKPHLRN